MEGQTWSGLVDRGGVPHNEHMAIISKLQQMHDDIDVEDWLSVLMEIANEFDLNTDALN